MNHRQADRRRIEALRNLAERPGTEAEGKVARAMLERVLAKERAAADPASDAFDKFKDYLRTGSMDDLAHAVGMRECDCGVRFPAFGMCPNERGHQIIEDTIRRRFPVGSRVYYNRWSYAPNLPGIVAGKPDTWNRLAVRFDGLKGQRTVPVYSRLGWHLTSYRVDAETLRKNGVRQGMEEFDNAEQAARDYADRLVAEILLKRGRV